MLTEKLQPRFGELDPLGHINNTVLPVWFEQARTPLFSIFNPDLNLNNWNLILKKLEVEFVAQMYFGKEVEIKTWVETIGNSSFVVCQEAWQDEKVVAKGACVMVYFDFTTQKSESIPDNFRQGLSEFLLEK